MKTRFIRNNRGQVAIFIALMFQVLFLFFAMIVNVGLLVHHKINLQNSVDLAAYYGASKQAEVMNAISHINYQIRQSWKLLVWRQKVLGTVGATSNVQTFPGEKLRSGVTPQERVGGVTDPYKKIFELPTFCITYDPHELRPGGAVNPENTCKNMHVGNFSVALPRAGILTIPSFFNFGAQVATAIRDAAAQGFRRCADTGALNFIMGSRFVISHYLDAEERSYLLNYLATGISAEEGNFFEINGDQVKIGLEKTLKKNLTDANADGVEYEIYNSLGSASCRNGTNSAGVTSPQWLVPIQTYPVWRYLDCNSNQDVDEALMQWSSRHLIESQPPARIGSAAPQLQQAFNDVAPYMDMRTTLIGYEKDPWCMPYVGVRAKSKPKIPFMPLSEIELTAEAYSKPFGGRIGPWYVKDWPQAVAGRAREGYKANSKIPNDMVESIGSVRVDNLSGLTNIDDASWAANIARFAGDPWGFSSEKILAYFHNALRIPSLNPTPRYLALTTATPNYPFPVNPAPETLSLRYYNDIATGYATNRARDQLTWDATANAAPRLRLLEIAAIAPTIFDLNYYSIEPDFYNNYYKPIEQYIQKRGDWSNNRVMLGDYGWRYENGSGTKSEKMNIMDQIKIQNDVGLTGALDSDQSMPYVVKKAEHLLNSWSVDNLLDYRNNQQKFGKCFSPGETQFTTPMDPPTPGNCVDGGRVGNSVKMVSKEYLKAGDLELGGSGTSGAIRNPPPW